MFVFAVHVMELCSKFFTILLFYHICLIVLDKGVGVQGGCLETMGFALTFGVSLGLPAWTFYIRLST